MANTFTNTRAALTGSSAVVYTCPVGATAIVLLSQATNVDNTGATPVTLIWNDGTNDTHLTKEVSIPAYASIGLLSGKLVLTSGNTLKANSDASSRVELTLSVLEIT